LTQDQVIRRWLAKVASPQTVARIVDPVLADIAWERGRPAWLGYVALIRALSVHAITSSPRALGRMWTDDDRAIPRAAWLAIVAACLLAIPLIALPLSTIPRARALHMMGRSSVIPQSLLLLLPQALVLTLPAGLLIAFPLAFKGRQPNRTLARRAIMLAFVYALGIGGLIVWGVPRANQQYRILISGDPGLAPGTNETGFAALRERIDVLKLTPGGRIAARPLEYLYQTRIALICAPLPLGLLALALAATPWGRRRPVGTGTTALAFYLIALFSMGLFARAVMRASPMPPSVLAWLPTAVIILLSSIIGRRRWHSPVLADAPRS
jgi:hypothetical protein